MARLPDSVPSSAVPTDHAEATGSKEPHGATIAQEAGLNDASDHRKSAAPARRRRKNGIFGKLELAIVRENAAQSAETKATVDQSYLGYAYSTTSGRSILGPSEGQISGSDKPEAIDQRTRELRTALAELRAVHGDAAFRLAVDLVSSLPLLPEKELEAWNPGSTRPDETPSAFISRVYGVWVRAGCLARERLARIAPRLAAAYSSWIRPGRHPERDLHLVTRQQKSFAFEAATRALVNANSSQTLSAHAKIPVAMLAPEEQAIRREGDARRQKARRDKLQTQNIITP